MQRHATTVLGVRLGDKVVVGSDGQVTLGDVVLKNRTCKVRKLYHDSVLVGFSGGTADAMALLDQLESRLEEFNGHLERAAHELARDWRTDRYLRRLEAMIIAMDKKTSLLISGEGDLLAPDDEVLAVGSGRALCAGGGSCLSRWFAFGRASGRSALSGDCRRFVHLHQPRD